LLERSQQEKKNIEIAYRLISDYYNEYDNLSYITGAVMTMSPKISFE